VREGAKHVVGYLDRHRDPDNGPGVFLIFLRDSDNVDGNDIVAGFDGGGDVAADFAEHPDMRADFHPVDVDFRHFGDAFEVQFKAMARKLAGQFKVMPVPARVGGFPIKRLGVDAGLFFGRERIRNAFALGDALELAEAGFGVEPGKPLRPKLGTAMTFHWSSPKPGADGLASPGRFWSGMKSQFPSREISARESGNCAIFAG